MRLLCRVSTILLRVDSDLVDDCGRKSQNGEMYTRGLCVQEGECEMMVIFRRRSTDLMGWLLRGVEVIFRSASEGRAVSHLIRSRVS